MNFLLIFFLFFNVILRRKNFIFILLRFEILVLINYIFLNYHHLNNSLNFNFCIYFIIFRVRERCLGLGLLINLIRNYGRDYLNNLKLII